MVASKLTKSTLLLRVPVINIYILIKIMKKPYLALFCSLFPFTVLAANPIDELANSVDTDSKEYANFLADFLGKDSDDNKSIAKEAITKSPDDSHAISKNVVEKADVLKPKLSATQALPEPDHTSEAQEKTYAKAEYGLMISNIPETSEISFNKDVNLLPYKNVAYYMKGKRVYFNPLKNDDGTYRNELVTFCSLNFTDYGIGRRIRTGKSYQVSEVGYSKSSQKIEKYGDVNIQKVVLRIDNDHLKAVTCFSTEKNNQFTIGDLMYEVGNIFDIKLRDYVDI